MNRRPPLRRLLLDGLFRVFERVKLLLMLNLDKLCDCVDVRFGFSDGAFLPFQFAVKLRERRPEVERIDVHDAVLHHCGIAV